LSSARPVLDAQPGNTLKSIIDIRAVKIVFRILF
jgi:hypothetical protein